jgi:hypothetical protein
MLTMITAVDIVIMKGFNTILSPLEGTTRPSVCLAISAPP